MMVSMSENTNTDVPEDFNVEEHDPLTPETFSFVDVLGERDYPKDVVELAMDEVAAYELEKIALKINQLPDGESDELEELLAEAEKYQARLEASEYVFHITGVSDDTITDLQEIASAEFEPKKKPIKAANGRIERILPEKEQSAYLRYFNALNLSVHIEQIVRVKDGAVMTAPPVDEIAVLMDKAPTSQKIKLQMAIQKLRAEAESFERRIDADFLAKR